MIKFSPDVYFRVSGSLPNLEASLSDKKLTSVMKMLDTLFPSQPLITLPVRISTNKLWWRTTKNLKAKEKTQLLRWASGLAKKEMGARQECGELFL